MAWLGILFAKIHGVPNIPVEHILNRLSLTQGNELITNETNEPRLNCIYLLLQPLTETKITPRFAVQKI